MKTLATHPDLVRAWLFALAGLPMPALPALVRAAALPPLRPLPSTLPPHWR